MELFKKLIIYLYLMLSWSIFGQETSNKAEIITTEFISDSGNIVAYNLMVSNKSYFIIKDLASSKEYTYEIRSKKFFLNDNIGVIYNFRTKELHFIDFKTQQIKVLQNIGNVEFLKKTDRLIYRELKNNALTILDLQIVKSISFEKVKFFSVSANEKKLVMIDENDSCTLLDLKTNREESFSNLSKVEKQMKKIVFNESNNTFYLISNSVDDMFVYEIQKKNLKKIGKYPIVNEVEKTVIDTLFNDLHLLANDELVVGVKPLQKNRSVQDADVQIWKGAQKGYTQNIEKYKYITNQIALINLKTGQWLSLADTNVNLIFKIDEQSQIYSFDRFSNDSLKRLDPFVSINKYDNERKPFKILNAISSVYSSTFNHKNYNFLIYFKDNNWYYYNDMLERTVSITKDVNADFYNKANLYTNKSTNTPSGFPLQWKDHGLLFSSDRDIWYFDLKTSKLTQKTFGSQNERKYRISNANYVLNAESWKWSLIPVNVKNYKDLVLVWSSNELQRQGMSLFTDKGQVIDLNQDDALYSQIKRSKDFIIYIKEKANSAPKMYVYDIKKQTEHLIYESNKHDKDVEDIISKYIYWRNENDEVTGGLLRFPKNYKQDSTTKYPVIVNVYEKNLGKQHKYYPTDALSVSQINYREFIDDDYFVIEPDIYYKNGDTGNSALNSVNAVIDYFAERYPLDISRMGIYGHSFGGYQTNYIITHTNRFKAAISSAGTAEIISEYFNYSNYASQPNFWRFENHQYRLGKSFFEDKEMYVRNSPIFSTQNVTTPLLLLTGNEDYIVNWQQSLLMFNALKKLNKEVTLLIYENEGHNIHKMKNQKDASSKVKQWFDYYLKDKEKPEWIE